MTFTRAGIAIGSFQIHYYGIILLTGAIVGLLLSMKVGKKRGIAPDTCWELFPWALFGGIIGSRLWHVLTPSSSSGIGFSYYLENPMEIFAIWKGGLGIPGAVIGGVVGVWLFCRRYHFELKKVTDSLVPGLALAQSIGRWGNFTNQELYGLPSMLPWAVKIDPAHRLPGYETVETYHPLFLYESIYNLINMAILLWVEKKFYDKLQAGDLTLLYFIIYPVGRFFLEFLRLDPSLVGGINVNQTIMLITASVAIFVLVGRHVLAHSKKQVNQ